MVKDPGGLGFGGIRGLEHGKCIGSNCRHVAQKNFRCKMCTSKSPKGMKGLLHKHYP